MVKHAKNIKTSMKRVRDTKGVSLSYIVKGGILKLKFKNKAMHCNHDHQEQMKRETHAAKETQLEASHNQRPCNVLLLPNANKINLSNVLTLISRDEAINFRIGNHV